MNWKQNVTVHPKQGITFRPCNGKPCADLTLKNTSNTDLLFKVRTTNPLNYVVKPHQAELRAGDEAVVNIQFNFSIDSP
jgi:hypothetical protein